MKSKLGIGMGVIAMGIFTSAWASAAAPEAKDVKRATDKCGNWIVEQFDRGSKLFGKDKSTTTLALTILALCESPRDYKEANGPFVSEPVKQLLTRIKKDGSVKLEKDEEPIEAMVFTIEALKSTQNEKHKETIELCTANFKKEFSTGLPVPDLNKMEYLTTFTTDPGSIRSVFLALHGLGEGTKEMSLDDGKPVKWGPIVAETLMKQQQKNGSFSEDIKVNAMALSILTKCWKAMK
jgi:hypothetical protein